MSNLLATPSICVTRVRGKRTYIRDGKLHAERVGEGRQTDVDEFASVLQVICPSCRGLGATPGGDELTEAQAVTLMRGEKPEEWDSIDELQTCRTCDGDGVVCEDSDPREDAADMEYHLSIER